MLRKRLITSLFMIVPLLAIFWLDTNATTNFGFPGLWLVAIILIFSLAVAGELLGMLREKAEGVAPWVVYCGVILCHAGVVAPELFHLPERGPLARVGCCALGFFVALSVAFLHGLVIFREDRNATAELALTAFVILYAGWALSFLAVTRVALENWKGAVALFSVLFIIKMSDAGAYFAGKRFGKRKLAPLLSPGKTIEGLVGGLVAAVLASVLVFCFVMPQALGNYSVPWPTILGYALSLTAIGVVGDLSESLIKRDMHRKDSSIWLPGLGGIMDMADSVILNAPVAFLWWSSGLL